MDILISVIGQRLFLPSCDANQIVEGSQNFVRFTFLLDEPWTELKTFAQFRQRGSAYNIYLDDDNSVCLPPEITAGTCELMLYGTKDTTIGTTNCLTFKVDRCRLIEDVNSTEITESLYNQLVMAVQDIENKVNDLGTVDVTTANIVISDRGESGTPIDLSEYDIGTYTNVYFLPGTYYVKPLDLSGLNHVRFVLGGAEIVCEGKYFMSAHNCNHLSIEGGTIIGGDTTTTGIKIEGCNSPSLKHVCIKNVGRKSLADGKGIYFVGDCTGLLVDQCTVENVTAGQISNPDGDDWIHAFGIFVNMDNDNRSKYTRYGEIKNCAFRSIKGIDRGEDEDGGYKKADGDGIFIQQLPYMDETDGTIKCLDSNIVIEGCTFDDCYKRGVKATARGVHLKNCQFIGDYWFAPAEFQYGHGTVENCHIVNSSTYNDGIVSGIVLCDGGTIVRDCYISCPSGEGFHNGIVFNTRNSRTPFTPNDPWDTCVFERCFFDGVEKGIHIYGTTPDNRDPDRIRGIDILDCRFGEMSGYCGVAIGSGIFNRIDSLRFVDFRFDYGDDRSAINTKYKETYGVTVNSEGQEVQNKKFSYPIQCQSTDLAPTYTYELRSKYWSGEPTISYGALPTPPNTKIIYSGDIGDILYKEYTAHGSRIFSARSPHAISKTLGKQLLYNSKLGDEYTDLATGIKYTCTKAGTTTDIGTWEQVGSGGSGENGAGIASIEQTVTSTEDGGENVVTVTLTDGNEATFTVKNGEKGEQGIQGEKGDTGAVGPQGPAGSDASVTVANISAALGYDPADRADVDVLGARMDAFTSLGEGSTTGDAELVDARVDIEGKVWANVGGHLRGITGKIVDACCDKVIVEGDNYNLFKTSEVELSARLQNDVEGTISSTATNAVTGWIPVTYGKYYALSTLHGDVGRTTGRNHFPRVQLRLSDGTVKLYATQEYPNTASSDTKILGVDHENAVAMRLQFQVKDASGTAQDISTADLLKAYAPMLVEGNTAEEAQSNAVTFEYMDGDAEAPGEVGYVLKADPAKADQEDLDSLKSRVDTFTSLDTSMLYEAQKRIASDWRIPFIDVFHKLGLGSNHVIPNSYDVWGGTGNDLTQKAVMMSDGVHPSMGDGVTMMYAQTIVPQLRAVPPLYSQDSESDDWTGKTILWMGTSIPAGSDSALGVEGIGTTYPAITASKLGATCTNIAKGSSCVRINSSSGDYSGFKYAHLIRALTRTKAETDAIQSDWDNIKTNVVEAATTISDSDLEVMKAHSFETLLLPYLDGTNAMPDLFVLDHGHNDIRPRGVDGLQDSLVQPTVENIENGTLAEDTYMIADNYANLKAVLNNDLSRVGDIESFAASLNRNCLIGAINFLITLIYSYNPRARIVIVSDYN